MKVRAMVKFDLPEMQANRSGDVLVLAVRKGVVLSTIPKQ
jgi:hypothetical protein